MTLTEFLLARIAEDEAWARLAQDSSDTSPWQQGIGQFKAKIGSYAGRGIAEARSINLARHIARHDPARVLAECEAKRRIVDLHRDRYSLGECAVCAEGWMDLTGGEGVHEPLLYPCDTLRALALPYADHADYREEWRA